MSNIKNLGLASLGAVLEYFDFVVYVYVAAAVGQAFFPADASPWLRQIQTFGIYAVGYLVRPIAGVAIAHYADKIGRKKLFVFTVLLMSVPTFLMGFLPTYNQVGWLAPVLLLTLRVLQGCAVGGELPGASVFIAEHASWNRLGVSSGIFFGVVNCGLLMGTGAAALAAMIAASKPEWSELAWRLPFIFGGLFGLLAAYLRRHLAETPLFIKIKEEQKTSKQTPLATVIQRYRKSCVFALAVVFVMSSMSGVYFQFLPNYLISHFHFSQASIFKANMFGVIAFVIGMPFWGYLSDRIGWGKTIGFGAVLNAGVCIWFFQQIPGFGPGNSALAYALIPVGLAGGFVHGLVPGLISSLFPTAIRQSGFAFPYSIGTAIFTGLTPLALAWLVQGSGFAAPQNFFLTACFVALCVALTARFIPKYLGRPPEAIDDRILSGDTASSLSMEAHQ